MARQELKDLAVNIYRNRGDALQAERVIAQARNIGKPLVVPGTSSHRIQEVVLKVNAMCVIDRPFRLIESPMRIKGS